jgi:hypothetical protein
MKPLKEYTTGALILLAIGLLAMPLDAGTSSPPATDNPATAPTPGDPFIKKDAPPVDDNGPVSNVILTVESYTLSQADGARLIQENETDQARHDQVLELVKAGKAHLDVVLCGAVKPFQQVTVEQVDDMPCAIAFKDSGKEVSATDFKRRSVGRRLVFKVSTNPDKQSCQALMFLECTNLKGFINLNEDNGTGPYIVTQPEFTTQRVNTAPAYLPYNQIRFLGTYSPTPLVSLPPPPPKPGDKMLDSQMILVFGKASLMQLDPGTLKDAKPSRLELQLSLYSMDRNQALQILSQKQKPDSAYQAVQSLVSANQAKLEHLTVLRTESGIQSNIDEVTERPYWTGGAEFVTQDVGFSEEMKPSYVGSSPFLTIDITNCRLLNDIGHLTANGTAPYNQTQPVFQIQSLVTMINSGLGEHELLGTISPPENTGVSSEKGDGRVWLAFLRTTAVNP